MAEEQTAVTGVLKIEIPNPALSVTLTFQASEDGDPWDMERLGAALAERGLRDAPMEAVAAFLARARSEAEPFATQLVEGTPPEVPEPERVDWLEALSMPENKTALQESILEASASPKITRDVNEKVEKQQQVTKKGLLGIGQGKVETVTVTETVTRTEKVYIDPGVQQCFFVENEQALGTFFSYTPGAPGKDVFGKPVPPKQLTDHRFYLADHIQRKGDDVVAQATGYLRIGKNWADIVPFSDHSWSVYLSPDQATCYVTIEPGHAASTAPSAQSILETAIALPYPEDSLVSVDELQAIVEQQIEAGESATVPISSSRDASFDIVVSEDKLEALLYVHKGKGRGKHLNLKEVGAAIKNSGLKKLDLKRIGDDIKAFYNGNEFDLTGYALTEGQAATPGPDRAIDFSLSFVSEATTAEHIAGLSGSGDHIESLAEFSAEMVQKTAIVEAEQLVAQIEPEAPGTPGVDVYGTVLPAQPGQVPGLNLFENVEQKGSIVATTSAGLLDFAEIDGAYFVRVRPHTDARIDVEISGDAMQAWISIEDGSGTGKRVTEELVRGALADAGVVTGIREEVLVKAVEAVQAGTSVEAVTIADGTEPINQSENRIEMLLEQSDGSAVRIRKDGTADFRTRNSITTVTTGSPLCRILPSQQEAIDGETVTGKPVAAKALNGIELDIGENVRKEDQEDGSILIIADSDGEFLYEKNRVEVRTTHTVKGDVDMNVGNLKFPGTVLIGGTIRTGFYVMSNGDIKVAGGVEGALLSSDGDIVIKQGVKGAGKAVLRSKQNISTPFVELATVLSVGDVLLATALVRSRIKSNGKIAFKGDKGRIVGGSIRARNGIEVTSIGSPRGVKTTISFGQDYLIGDLIDKEEKEIEKVKARITKIDLEMRRAEKAGADEKLTSLRHEKVKVLKLMEKRGLRLFTLRERFEQHFPSKVIVSGAVHAGTIFESHGRTIEIKEAKKGIIVEFDAQTGNLGISDLKQAQG